MIPAREPDPKDILRPDLCIIGGGPAGLSAAALAVSLGASVVLVEKGRMGGECLNAGCIPSKTLIAAARRADHCRQAGRFGVSCGQEPEIDFAKVRDRIRDVVRSIAPMDSRERYSAMGVQVLEAEARFVDRSTVIAGPVAVRARRFIIATGSQPTIPAIPGLESISFLTEDSLFDLAAKPDHLVILGGGAVGIEMAQAYRRLGVRVTVIEAGERILAGEDVEMAGVIERVLRSEGVTVRTGVAISSIERRRDEGFAAILREGGTEATIEGSHLLIATGRLPGLDGLGLGKAGIESDASGIRVDHGLRTANARVYAIGDCLGEGRGRFTHMANHQAGLVVRNALFRLPIRLGAEPIPRVIYTDPEIAAVGLLEDEARAQHADMRILRWSFADNDRARTEGLMEGHIKAIVTPHGRILGCAIAGPQAGELIGPWVLAMARHLKISDLAGVVYPYPTLSEITKSAAVEFLKPTAQNPWVRRLLGFVRRLG